MTHSIWSANAASGGLGLFDLFSNLDATRTLDGTGTQAGDAMMAEIGPQPADMQAADLNFFNALNEALATQNLSDTPTPSTQWGVPQPNLEQRSFGSGEPQPSDETNQLALALLAGGVAQLPPTLVQPQRSMERPASETLYEAPKPQNDPFLQIKHQQLNTLGSEETIAPSHVALLNSLQARQSPLKVLPKDVEAILSEPTPLPPSATPDFKTRLQDELSRIAPGAKIEMLSVKSENAAAAQPEATAFVPLSQSLQEMGAALKDHQKIFNQRLADLENKMTVRLDESRVQQMMTPVEKVTTTEQAPPLAALTQMQAETTLPIHPQTAHTTAVHAISQRLNPKTNDAQNGEFSNIEQTLDARGAIPGVEIAGQEAGEKREEQKERGDGKREGLDGLSEHKGLAKMWTAERLEKGVDVANTSPLARGTLERTRNMAIQLQGRGGTAKIQITDARVGSVNLEIRVEQGNKVFVEIRSGNQKLKEELRDNVEALKRSLEDNRMSLAELKFTVDNNAVMQSGSSANSQQSSQQNNSARQDAQNLQQQLQERAQQDSLNRQFFGGQNSGQNSYQSGEGFSQESANHAVRNKGFNQAATANLNSRETNINAVQTDL